MIHFDISADTLRDPRVAKATRDLIAALSEPSSSRARGSRRRPKAPPAARRAAGRRIPRSTGALAKKFVAVLERSPTPVPAQAVMRELRIRNPKALGGIVGSINRWASTSGGRCVAVTTTATGKAYELAAGAAS